MERKDNVAVCHGIIGSRCRPMHMTITRVALDGTGTLSEINIDDKTFFGIEKPWRDNKSMVSCIPNGYYALIPFKSKKFGDTWAFVGGTVSSKKSRATKRYACLIHKGNTGDDVQGCLAIGSAKMNAPAGKLGVAQSSRAWNSLNKMLRGAPYHTVEINWA